MPDRERKPQPEPESAAVDALTRENRAAYEQPAPEPAEGLSEERIAEMERAVATFDPKRGTFTDFARTLLAHHKALAAEARRLREHLRLSGVEQGKLVVERDAARAEAERLRAAHVTHHCCNCEATAAALARAVEHLKLVCVFGDPESAQTNAIRDFLAEHVGGHE